MLMSTAIFFPLLRFTNSIDTFSVCCHIFNLSSDLLSSYTIKSSFFFCLGYFRGNFGGFHVLGVREIQDGGYAELLT